MPVHPTVVLASPSWSLNGPNVFSANLARGLNRLHIPAHILVTRSDWFDAKPLPRTADVQFQTLPVGRFSSLAARWKAMIRYLEERAPCIYIPNYDFGHSCVSPNLSKSVSIIGVIHSDDPQHYEHVRRLGRYWNAVVAVSPAIGAAMLKIQPRLASRLSVVPYGVTAASKLAERSPEIDRPLRIIYAGRLDQAQKRVLDLPEIVKAATDLGVPIHMTIAGGGPLEAQLKRRFGAIDSEPRAEFLGTLDACALVEVLARQDAFLLPSAFEGLPIGVLEAMGQGCIPLVSDIRSGIPELIQDRRNGFRIPVGDVQGFAKRIATLFHNPGLRREMSEAAYSTAQSSYRMDRMVESYVQLFTRAQDESRLGIFRRPPGHTQPPPNLPWQEYLPASLQRAGHYARRLAPGTG